MLLYSLLKSESRLLRGLFVEPSSTRLWVKTSVGFFPMTFVHDTSLPGWFYMNREAMWQLKQHRQLHFHHNGSVTIPMVSTVTEHIPVLPSELTNVMGLSLLQHHSYIKWLGGCTQVHPCDSAP